jgi:hypothetical protein
MRILTREWQKRMVVIRMRRIRRTWNSCPPASWETASARSLFDALGGFYRCKVWLDGGNLQMASTVMRKIPDPIVRYTFDLIAGLVMLGNQNVFLLGRYHPGCRRLGGRACAITVVSSWATPTNCRGECSIAGGGIPGLSNLLNVSGVMGRPPTGESVETWGLRGRGLYAEAGENGERGLRSPPSKGSIWIWGGESDTTGIGVFEPSSDSTTLERSATRPPPMLMRPCMLFRKFESRDCR